MTLLAADAMLKTITDFLTVFGLPTALVLFFVYVGYCREQVMSNRINDLEHFGRDTLLTALRESTEAHVKSVEVQKECVTVIRQNNEVMRRLELQLAQSSLDHHKP